MTRRLDWAGALNVRDLGGVPLAAGGETRFGELVRADNVSNLTGEGWRALADHGVTRIVDLRWPEELAVDPPRDVDIEVVHVSLFGASMDPEFDDPIGDYVETDDSAGYFGWMYERTFEVHSEELGRVLAAIADAPPGVTLFHCHAGKDRTGIVAALLLRLAGVAADEIAEDYALSGPNLYADQTWIDEAPTEELKRARALRMQAPAGAMAQALRTLDERHGGVEAYLRHIGVDDARVERLRHRLAPA